MPVMDGMTAAKKIRAYEKEHDFSRTPIFALSALTSPAAKTEALLCEMDRFFLKPVNFKELLGFIYEVVAER
jgi:CheY-like chemotaxis protein